MKKGENMKPAIMLNTSPVNPGSFLAWPIKRMKSAMEKMGIVPVSIMRVRLLMAGVYQKGDFLAMLGLIGWGAVVMVAA